jgi:hypothetical protein
MSSGREIVTTEKSQPDYASSFSTSKDTRFKKTLSLIGSMGALQHRTEVTL